MIKAKVHGTMDMLWQLDIMQVNATKNITPLLLVVKQVCAIKGLVQWLLDAVQVTTIKAMEPLQLVNSLVNAAKALMQLPLVTLQDNVVKGNFLLQLVIVLGKVVAVAAKVNTQLLLVHTQANAIKRLTVL